MSINKNKLFRKSNVLYTFKFVSFHLASVFIAITLVFKGLKLNYINNTNKMF